jgi:peptidyl-tRNA hydrolase
MAYEDISGGQVWKRVQARKVFAKDWQVGENFKLQAIVNDTATVDIWSASIQENDRSDINPETEELVAVLRLDLVKRAKTVQE